jgi:pimeloyl-ACP methyl ester carboxylesterase
LCPALLEQARLGRLSLNDCRRRGRTQALDLPGLGSIPARADVASYSDLVKYVAKKIDTPTALVGQSMGAFVAIELALRYPRTRTR